MPEETTMYDLFRKWASGEILQTRTCDYHVIDAMHRFELFLANQYRDAAVEEKIDTLRIGA